MAGLIARMLGTAPRMSTAGGPGTAGSERAGAASSQEMPQTVVGRLVGQQAAADPFEADLGPGAPTDPVIHQVTAVLLGYPTRNLLELMPDLAHLARRTGDERFIEAVDAVICWAAGRPLDEVQSDYVQEFDLSRRHSLNLSYWTDGDTRRRGEALTRFKRVYRDSGWVTDLQGELPDYLPMVLEFAAQVDPVRGRAVLQAYRPSLELLRLALIEDEIPHAGLLRCLCATLPGASPETAQAVQKMAGYGPPQESVGLASSDPRLLPMADQPGAAGAAGSPCPPQPAGSTTGASMSGARR